jgi:phosphoglycerol transferase MdoB-like AlkP superfamily enzyme
MIKGHEKGSLWQFPVLLFFTGFLVLVIRGGLQTIPINQSNVYFSDKMFANHAAVNFAWNFSHSLTHQSYDMVNPFVEMETSEAENIVKEARISLINQSIDSTNYHILNTPKPNIILIIWESLTAKVVDPLGGEPNVTENFNQLTKEGILFDNFYANGDRSDKGMVAILSGYPSQPHQSIIKIPNKTRNLPMLSQKMINLGYATSFSYGGDLNFGNMNTYFRQGGISQFVDGDHFDDEDWNSKWGVHDHILMKRFLADRIDEPQPFFSIVFTLSSHEPFEFPEVYKFGKDTEENKFRSAHAYTDKVIGNFIEQAKKQTWWDNTLVVIMADHGHPLPKKHDEFNSPQRFHIPMLFIGGAVAQKNTRISNFGSQTDFAYSLLSLLGADPSDFKWGNNILKPSPNHFAHFVFNKGFGIINKNGAFVYDYVAQKKILNDGKPDKNMEKLGKAMTQITYQDFLTIN